VALAGVFDKDATHHTSGHGQKVRAILPAHLADLDKAKIGLVDQGRRLQHVLGSLTGHVSAGETV
jgi:hypothetical protein